MKMAGRVGTRCPTRTNWVHIKVMPVVQKPFRTRGMHRQYYKMVMASDEAFGLFSAEISRNTIIIQDTRREKQAATRRTIEN